MGLINFSINPDSTGIFPSPASVPEPVSVVRQFLQLQPYISRQRAKTVLPVESVNGEAILPGETFVCATCKQDCTKLRYQHTSKYYATCAQCFAQGKFAEGVHADQFDRVDQTEMWQSDPDWTDEQVLKLYEGLEQFGDDWNKIAAHVGFKSKEECLLKFIRNPTEDSFLQSHVITNSKEEPFKSMNNPLMAVLAFVSEAVHPSLAASAAKAALETFMELRGTPQDEMDTDQNTLSARDEFDSKLKATASAALSAAAIKATVSRAGTGK